MPASARPACWRTCRMRRSTGWSGSTCISPILLTKYAVRSMMAAGAGRIVSISSIVGTTGYAGLSVYSATKASLLGFTRSLAREVGPLDITVNAVAPGFVDTEMTHDLGEAHRAQIARRSALKRMPEIADVAAAVDYLFSAGRPQRDGHGVDGGCEAIPPRAAPPRLRCARSARRPTARIRLRPDPAPTAGPKLHPDRSRRAEGRPSPA